MRRALLFVLLLRAAPAIADGGSSAGNDFFDSGGGGGSSSSSSSASSSSGPSWPDNSGAGGGTYTSSGGGHGGGGPVATLATLVVLYGLYRMFRRSRGGGAARPGGAKMDVSVLRLGIDSRARKHVQTELDQLARASDVRTPDGLAALLRDSARLLRRCRESWIYAGVVNADPMSAADAESVFRREAASARAAYKDELLRVAAGGTTTAPLPADVRPRPEEGAGLVVATLIVCARGALIDFKDPSDAEEVRRWLEAMSQLTGATLVALEVVWAPSADDDRMSSLELETKYPDMIKIRGSDPLYGKTLCAFCSGIFPAELRTCPHCNARIPEAA
ncbi:MAG TPA: DUF1517 domain-containing protein [Kofleriaceae bacterium]|nr:DUF1517 domain-containing protein [Kofleriaceae bacterium]